MKAVWKLLGLPMRQMPVAVVLVLLLFLASLALLLVSGKPSMLLLTGLAVLFWHMLAGIALRGLMRAHTRMLPSFGRRLLQAGLLDLTVCVLVPGLLARVAGPALASHAALAFAGLLLVAAMGMATGAGMRALMLAWVGLVAMGWFPRLGSFIAYAVVHSPLTPLALVLLAVLLVHLAVRPLFRLDDREVAESPLGTALGGSPSRYSGPGPGRPRSRLGRLLSRILEGQAETHLQRALHRYERKTSKRHRIALVRAVLLPHDSLRAVLVQVAVTGLFATFYFFATHAATRWNAVYVGGYAVFVGTARFNTVGRGLKRMRPNLAELYMTLAPCTHAEFQSTLVDALKWLVVVSVFYCLALGVLVDVLMHAHQPVRLLLAVLISGSAASVFAFSAYLVGPESTSGQVIMRLVLVLFYMGLYALAYWLLGRFGLGPGALLGMLFTWTFGIGTWLSARREYLRRTPRFDVPL
jgi:hypothetical protein